MVLKQVDADSPRAGARCGTQQDREIAPAHHADLEHRAGDASVLLELEHVHRADGGALMQPARDAANDVVIEVVAFRRRAGHASYRRYGVGNSMRTGTFVGPVSP